MLVAVVIAAALPAACATYTPADDAGDRSVDSAGATPTAPPSETGEASAQGSTQLVLWVVPGFDPEGEGHERLADLLDSYAAAHPQTSIRTVAKLASGPASMLQFLESTFRVVPSAMPDLALVPLSSIAEANEAGWLKPVPDTVPSDRLNQAFSFARDLVEFDAPRAVPFAVDTTHTLSFGSEPPTTWEDVDQGPRSYYVPGLGDQVGSWSVLLSLYGSAGGNLSDLTDINADALRSTSEFLIAAQDAEHLAVTEGTTPRSSWNALLGAEEGAGAVSGGVFASQQANFPGMEWAPLPGADGPAPPVAWGWAFALTSQDPGRLLAAGELVAWLTGPDARDWVLESGYLPAWKEGFEDDLATLDTPPDRGYSAFLSQQLASADGIHSAAELFAVWPETIAESMPILAAALDEIDASP